MNKTNKINKKLFAVALLLVACGLLAGFVVGRATDDRKYYANTGSDLPFSLAVEAGDTVYLAGTIGIDPETGAPPADAKAEAHIAMNNIRTRLEAAGLTMDDLVTVTVYCPDLTLYDAFNEVYRSYFKENFPARAFIGSGPLLRGGRFEIQGIAARR